MGPPWNGSSRAESLDIAGASGTGRTLMCRLILEHLRKAAGSTSRLSVGAATALAVLLVEGVAGQLGHVLRPHEVGHAVHAVHVVHLGADAGSGGLGREQLGCLQRRPGLCQERLTGVEVTALERFG